MTDKKKNPEPRPPLKPGQDPNKFVWHPGDIEHTKKKHPPDSDD
jgi:hypothetical protein